MLVDYMNVRFFPEEFKMETISGHKYFSRFPTFIGTLVENKPTTIRSTCESRDLYSKTVSTTNFFSTTNFNTNLLRNLSWHIDRSSWQVFNQKFF